jgi:hypothetical protein
LATHRQECNDHSQSSDEGGDNADRAQAKVANADAADDGAQAYASIRAILPRGLGI